VTNEVLWVIVTGTVTGVAAAALHLRLLGAGVRALLRARRPLLATAAGLSARLLVTGSIFYAVVRLGGPAAAVACLAGFTVMRSIMLARLRPAAQRSAS
jgi:hypothetical protein